MISDKNLSVCYRRYTGRCPCQRCVERTCLVWCTLQILGETCHTSFENVFESSIKHIHKKLCRHQFILAGICCLLLLWLWGTGLAEDREGSGNTFPPPMSLWSRGIFFFQHAERWSEQLASRVNLLESWKLWPSHYESSFLLMENFLFLENPKEIERKIDRVVNCCWILMVKASR